jgi:hypothetical protein
MATNGNVVYLDRVRAESQQELIDDISARAFLFLRDEALAVGVPMQSVIAEHLLGVALVVRAVEGAESARKLLDLVSKRIVEMG